jgi:hypothetical protein
LAELAATKLEVTVLRGELTGVMAAHSEDIEALRQECNLAIQAAEDRAATTLSKALAEAKIHQRAAA